MRTRTHTKRPRLTKTVGLSDEIHRICAIQAIEENRSLQDVVNGHLCFALDRLDLIHRDPEPATAGA